MKKILIIEDDVLLSKMMFDRLKCCSEFNVEKALTGIEGLNKVNEFKPEYLLLDLELPDIHGFDVLDIVKKNYSEIKTIIVSINASGQNKRTAEKMGAKLFLEKPFDLDALINFIGCQNH
ncbi:response regulator [candidate division KSB1 bacterium]